MSITSFWGTTKNFNFSSSLFCVSNFSRVSFQITIHLTRKSFYLSLFNNEFKATNDQDDATNPSSQQVAVVCQIANARFKSDNGISFITFSFMLWNRKEIMALIVCIFIAKKYYFFEAYSWSSKSWWVQCSINKCLHNIPNVCEWEVP